MNPPYSLAQCTESFFFFQIHKTKVALLPTLRGQISVQPYIPQSINILYSLEKSVVDKMLTQNLEKDEEE